MKVSQALNYYLDYHKMNSKKNMAVIMTTYLLMSICE